MNKESCVKEYVKYMSSQSSGTYACIIYVARWDHSFVAAPHVKYVVIVAARSSVQAPLVLSY